MAISYHFEGDYNNELVTAFVKLLLIHFVDEKKTHIIYSPHLDLSGYGHNLSEAKSSFEIAFEDFMDYTLKKKTLGKVLKSLGWQFKGAVRKPKKAIVPSITDVIKDNDYVSEIFDRYPVHTYHEEVSIPAYA